MRSLLAAIAAAIFFLAPVSATAADNITRLTPEKLSQIVETLAGKKPEIDLSDKSSPTVSIDTGNGSDFFILSQCTEQGCLDIQMLCFFDKDPRYTLAAVNSYNGAFVNAQATLTTDGKVYLVRDYLVEGGVSEANIIANIQTYDAADDVFIEHMKKQETAAIPSAGGVPAAATTPSLLQTIAPELIKKFHLISADPKRAHQIK